MKTTDDLVARTIIELLRKKLPIYLKQYDGCACAQSWKTRIEEFIEWLATPGGSKWLGSLMLDRMGIERMLEEYAKYLANGRPYTLSTSSAAQYVSTVRGFSFWMQHYFREVLREASILLSWLGR